MIVSSDGLTDFDRIKTPDEYELYMHMIVKWLIYTMKFNFTSGYYVQPRYRHERTTNAFLEGPSRKVIRGAQKIGEK